jgi:hypothetical protein
MGGVLIHTVKSWIIRFPGEASPHDHDPIPNANYAKLVGVCKDFTRHHPLHCCYKKAFCDKTLYPDAAAANHGKFVDFTKICEEF